MEDDINQKILPKVHLRFQHITAYMQHTHTHIRLYWDSTKTDDFANEKKTTKKNDNHFVFL